jgi:E3 ubiquitin-protein ligase UBR1
MYPKIIETFILRDREPEHSVRLMTVQLFSVPSIARELVASHDYNFLQKLLLMLQAVFTGGLTQMSLELPPLPPANGMASPQSMLIRHQRCYQMFHDVRYLLAATGVQTLLVEQSAHLDYFLPFLALFNGIAPNRRAQGEHVEFESEVWVPVFHVVTQLARAAAQFGAAFSRATSLQLSDALVTTARVILMNTLKLHQNQPDSYEPIESRLVSFAGQTYDIIDFHVDAQPVSFHHPMHWLLAELLKHVNGTITPEALSMFAVLRSARTDSFTLPDIFPRDVDESARLTIIDFPLRVIVKLAQIRAGMWVRNGYMIRQQAHHYREHTMRDCMSDQDLFLVQAGLMLVSADRLLVSVLDRFALREWFDGEREHEVLSEDQCSLMVEELLLLLVTLVSETSIAQSWAIEQQVRREIVHFLALSQGTYSDLTKHISDRFTDHSSFDRMLAQVSNFRAPDGTADLGMFELRDECYDEVQPFFFHYTRNQREKADDVLRERHRKRNGGQQAAADAYVAVPARRLAPGQGIFIGSLHSALTSPVLIRIATAALERWGVSGDPAMPEPYVDAALQLLMHVLIERGAEGARAMAQPHNQSLGCAIDVLCDLEKFITFKPIKAKASWLVDRALAEDREAVAKVLPADRVTQAKSQGAPAAEDPKRAAARARQAAIMQQFSAQQKSLLDALADEELDEDGAGDGEDVTMADDDAPSGSTYRSMGDCIMCQESLDGSSAFGSLALVQSSRILRTTPRRQGVFLQQALDTPLTLDRNGPDGRRVTNAYREPVPGTPAASSSVYYPAEDHRDGFFASTCGHMMHVNCFDSYCRSVEHRHGQQIARNHPENLTRHEFVCPLCKSLGNVILPVPDEEATAPPTLIAMPLTEWMRKINIEILKTSASSGPTELQELEHGTGSFVPWYAEEALVWAREQQGAQVNLDQATWKMLDRLVQVLRPLSSRTRPAREAFQIRSILAPPGRKMYMPEELVAYTISMLEVSQRGTTPTQSASPNATVADSLPDPTNQLLNSLLHALRSIARVDHAGPRGLATMQQGLLKRLLPHWGNDETVRGPLLLRDPLTILIEAAVLAPGSLGQITTLMYYATLVHVIFGLAQPSIWPQTASHMGRAPSAGLRPAELGPGEAEMLRTVFPDVRWTVANIIGFVGYARGNITLGVDALDDVSLAKMLCTYTLPFLRRAAILHRAVGLKMAPASAASGTSEYLRLLHGLQIPPPAEGLPVRAERQTALASMVEGWIKHAYTALASLFRPLPIYAPPISALGTPGTHLHPSSAHPTLQLEHPHIYELVQLPRDLATLLQDTQRRICKRCKEAPPEPAVCLECGDVLCVQCFCCQDEQSERGECNRHLEECGGATGVFFKVKTNIIVLLYAGNGSYTTSPYLDTHGEFDIGLRKGRPQHLHAQRYDEQRKQWLTQSVPHVVARKLESVMDQGGWSTL